MTQAASGPLLSPAWFRVAALKPRLRPHAELSRHRYRGEVWFVLRDPASGRSHRCTPGARLILQGMDGSRSVAALWALAERQLGERAPTQDELITLLAQLHAADLLQCDVSPDVAELFQRGQQQQSAHARQRYANPLSLKLPLIDPDRLLDALVPALRPLWNRWGALAWAALVLPAALLALGHAQDLTHNLADRVSAVGNLFMLWLLFPLIKLLHELGHGLATKVRGGEVHEAGVMLLVLMPVPYVDASSANAFRDKRDRAVVAAAGMGVELLLAALAMYLWLLLEPGLLRSLCFNTMLVAGVSTLVFNGNPLLRYDAYFILADLVEMPNLGQRANRFVGALAQRWLFRASDVPLPPASRGEGIGLTVYALASFVYRTFVSVAIILFIASEFLVVGVVLAGWGAVTMLVLPLWKLLRHLRQAPELQRVRGRVLAVAGGGTLAFCLFAGLVPLPSRSQTQGVVWLPEQSLVRAAASGFQSRWLAQPGQAVHRGDPLMESIDPALQTQLRVGQARLAELQAQLGQHWVHQPLESALLREDIARAQAVQDRLAERASGLVALSPSDGVFVVPQALDQPGRFHRQGDLLGYVTGPASAGPDGAAQTVVRVIVPQGDVDLVRLATRRVELRHAYALDRVRTGTVVRELPAGAEQLPSRALGAGGGGMVVVDPRDSQGLRALQRSFQLDIALPADAVALYGARVHVRFEHPPEPLARQAWRGLRQVFLSRFHA